MGNANIRRGLATALSIATILTLLVNIGFCETTNDLRKFLGMSPKYYVSSYKNEDITGIKDSGDTAVDTDIESTEKNEEDIETEKVIQIIESNKDISNLEDSVKQLEIKLKSRLQNNSTAYVIKDTVDKIVKLNNDIINILNSGTGYAGDSVISQVTGNTGTNNSTDASYDDAEATKVLSQLTAGDYNLDDIYSVDYYIGSVGSTAHCIVENYFKLVTPWGFTKHASEDKFTSSKLLGMDLFANPGDNILSQWNGIVISISKDQTGSGQVVKIYHGSSTYTVYHHIMPLEGIRVGSVVTSGQILGACADTSTSEPNKDNHVFYQIKLDGSFINPLLIYGERGKAIYERWLTSTAYDNLVESGESYYNNSDDSFKTEWDNTDWPDEVIYPDFNLDTPDDEDLDLDWYGPSGGGVWD